MRRRTGAAARAIAFAAWLALGCSPEAPPQAPSPEALAAARSPGASVILLSIDTLRADRLGAYGYPRPTSPALDALASRGVRFARAVAESSWTLPSHVTLMTGLLPTAHGVRHVRQRPPAGLPMLAQVLGRAGYRTLAFVDGALLSGFHGFARGFERYEDRDKNLRETLELARQALDALPAERPYFLFLHTYDVHCPYDPPPEYALRFRTRPPEDHLETAGRCGKTDFNAMALTRGQARFLSDQYDGNIRAADDTLGEFVRWLDERNAFERTVLVVVSDHGEEFLEHGTIGHKNNLYIESLRVPLIVLAPKLRPRVVESGAGLADVMPTVLDLLDLPAPPTQGRSLLPAMLGASDDAPRPLPSQLWRAEGELRSVVAGDRHLILDTRTGDVELYHLGLDAGERLDLSWLARGSRGELLAALERRLEQPIPVRAESTGGLPADLTQQLRALGYVE
jgi:arylsulfatase A-like enzyme